ncbi:MAG: hypothetical protein Phog2KO_24640 [Phototrophicaceae bacterium]
MSMTDPLIGKKLGDYNIEGVLGTGGMARVYRGYDDNLDRYAAIKVIEPQLIASTEENEYRERFLREARAIARLNHPHIVSIYQFNQIGNVYYIAMEYAKGDNLRDILKGYIKDGQIMPTDRLLKILSDIASALDYAHQQQIIHRDIKPSNIIVSEKDNAVLTDFGLALNATEGTIGNTFGSVHYIAPEQAISSAQAVAQSDQYSLGIVAYELLTGRVPFDDASAMSIALKHISDPPPPPTELNPNIPAEVEQVLMRSLDKDPTKRFDTAKEFVSAMELAFNMVDNADIDAPNTLKEAIGAPPPTQLLSPFAESDSIPKIPEASRPSFNVPPTQKSNRTGVYFVIALVLIALIALAYVLSTGAFGVDTNATETHVALLADTQATETQESITVLSAQATDDAITASEEVENTATDDVRNTVEASATMPEDTIEPSDTDVVDSATLTIAPTTTETLSPTATATSSPTVIPSNTPQPSTTPTASFFIANDDETDTRQILLRYDGRSLIIANRDMNESLDLSDLRFVLFEPDDEGELRQTRVYNLDGSPLEVRAGNMIPERCLQILANSQYSSLPPTNTLADDLCTSLPFWSTTVSTFWTSTSSEAYFEVRLGAVDVIGVCEVQRPATRAEQRCAIDINNLP